MMIGLASDDPGPLSSPPPRGAEGERPAKRLRAADPEPEAGNGGGFRGDATGEMNGGAVRGDSAGNGEAKPAPAGPPAKRQNSIASYFSARPSAPSPAPAPIPADRPGTPPDPAAEDDLHLERTCMAPDWFRAFEKEMGKPYFKEIKAYLAKENKAGQRIFPPDESRYSFTQCPLDRVKVVILGQDPYHGPGQAHGLAFSVRKGVQVPPSLANMFQELAKEYDGTGEGEAKFVKPNHGCLEGWAVQGVLLLNAALSVRAGQANSHQAIGWERFTDAIIDHVNARMAGVVFLLWGAFAGKKGARIDKKKHLVLQSPHPSPLSAHRGFLGNNHFKQANAYLVQKGKTPIDWSSLP
ncbi:uracil-DNA glycosylase-like protein [Hyaloraphidium curvatum]|nr:uracil-DNA glycosylase-like protein [Hyaloraphidium curvatum]